MAKRKKAKTKATKAGKKVTKRKRNISVRVNQSVTGRLYNVGGEKIIRLEVDNMTKGKGQTDNANTTIDKANKAMEEALFIAKDLAREWDGFLKGDGCVRIAAASKAHRAKGQFYPQIIFGNTDRELMENVVKAIAGSGRWGKARRLPSGKMYYTYIYSKSRDVVKIAQYAAQKMTRCHRQQKLALVASYPVFTPGRMTDAQRKFRLDWLKKWDALLKQQKKEMKNWNEPVVKRRSSASDIVKRISTALEEAKEKPFSGTKVEVISETPIVDEVVKVKVAKKPTAKKKVVKRPTAKAAKKGAKKIRKSLPTTRNKRNRKKK